MPLIRDAIQAWRGPVMTTDEEGWQARRGLIFIATTHDPSIEPDLNDGLLLSAEGIRIRGGLNVWYRRAGRDDAIIAREVI